MRRILLAGLIVLFAADAADARKRHRHHRHHQYFVVLPQDARNAFDAQISNSRGIPRTSRRSGSPADPIPPAWQLQPPEPNWNGKRYVSPDGSAWFAAYKTPANAKAISEHMKSIAFAGDDETITYLHGERTWIAASGFKDSRIFYRRAILACAGQMWHHIAFEYPVEQKNNMDRFVAAAAQALVASQTECDTAVTSRP